MRIRVWIHGPDGPSRDFELLRILYLAPAATGHGRPTTPDLTGDPAYAAEAG